MRISDYEKVPDISHWNSPVNMSNFPTRGVHRVLIKATEGIGGLDPAYKANRKEAIAKGLAWSTYHYYRAAYDPVKQARFFVETSYSDDFEPSEPLTLDVEDPPTQGSVIASSNVLLCLQEIERLTGERPTIYTRASFWKQYYYSAYGWASNYPLHIAHYKDFYAPSICMPWMPTQFEKWQFTDRDNGKLYGTASLQIDMSVAIPVENRVVSPVKYQDFTLIALLSEEIPAPKLTLAEVYAEWRLSRKDNFRKG